MKPGRGARGKFCGDAQDALKICVYQACTWILRELCTGAARLSVERPRAATMSTEEPNLKKSVERLKFLSHNIFKKSPKDVGEAYLAAVGLLVHLKKDQSTLHCRR